jgi:hypothetical protein
VGSKAALLLPMITSFIMSEFKVGPAWRTLKDQLLVDWR